MDSSIRHILVRHEQGAGHAAQGYAAATGRVGVCMATSGPGATNLVTPLADAHMDSVPMVAVTGQVGAADDRHRRLPGGRHPRHHDADHQAQLPGHRPRRHPAHDRRGVPHRLHRPARAGAGRRREVGAAGRARPSTGRPSCTCPATAPSPSPTPSRSARPPGSCWSRGGRCSTSAAARSAPAPTASCCALAELTGIPVVTTLMARGAFPDSHVQHLGMPGMHGTVAAVGALQRSDLHHQPGRPLRRPGHRQPRLLRPARAGRARRHRPRRDRQEPARRRADRGRRARGHRRPRRRAPGRGRGGPHRRLRGVGGVGSPG